MSNFEKSIKEIREFVMDEAISSNQFYLRAKISTNVIWEIRRGKRDFENLSLKTLRKIHNFMLEIKAGK